MRALLFWASTAIIILLTAFVSLQRWQLPAAIFLSLAHAFCLRSSASKRISSLRNRALPAEFKASLLSFISLHLLVPIVAFSLPLLLAWRIPQLGEALPYLSFWITTLLVFFLMPQALLPSELQQRPPISPVPTANVDRHATRGEKCYELEDVAHLQKRHLPNDDPGHFLGGIRVPSYALSQHFLAVGVNGAGKTLTLTKWMDESLHRLNETNSRALFYDPKNDVISKLHAMGLGSKLRVLNPFDNRCVAWDLAADFTDRSYADSLAGLLITKLEQGSNNSFFNNAASDFVSIVIETFITQSPGKWTLRDILLALSTPDRLNAILRKTPRGRDAMDTYRTEESKQGPDSAGGILSTVQSELKRYRIIAALWHNAKETFSVTEWLSSNYILVMPEDTARAENIHPLNALLFRRISDMLLAPGRPETDDVNTWLILDELTEAPKLEGLLKLAKMGRSKGVSIALGMQDFAGLKAVYGPDDATSIWGQCNHKAILRVTDAETAEHLSKQIGSIEELRISHNTSRNWQSLMDGPGKGDSEQASIAESAKVLPIEIQSLPNVKSIGRVAGYYVTGGIYPVFHSELPIKDFLSATEDVPDDRLSYINRNADDQELHPWVDADLKRLGLDRNDDRPPDNDGGPGWEPPFTRDNM